MRKKNKTKKLPLFKPEDTLKLSTGVWFECSCGTSFLPPEPKTECDECGAQYKCVNPLNPSVYEIRKSKTQVVQIEWVTG